MKIDYQPTTKNDNWASTRTIKPAGIVCHSTAWPGKDAQAIRDYFDAPNRGASIHAAVDNKRIIQCMPWERRCGHVGGGSKGSYNNTHIGVEMCEPPGICYNASGSAITAYDPPEGYFCAAWNNMVSLFAYLCGKYDLDPLGENVIVSHAEAHALGYGSNHADTGHWFPIEGRTMDDFRAAVAAKMEEKDVTYEQFLEFMDRYNAEAVVSEPSAWAVESCSKAVEKGIVKGDGKGAYNWQKPVTREALLTILDRTEILK